MDFKLFALLKKYIDTTIGTVGGKLKPLIFTGAVEGSYDGSEVVEIEVADIGEASPGQVLGMTDSGVSWVNVSNAASEEDMILMLSELDIFPAATSDGAILTDENGNILLW